MNGNRLLEALACAVVLASMSDARADLNPGDPIPGVHASANPLAWRSLMHSVMMPPAPLLPTRLPGSDAARGTDDDAAALQHLQPLAANGDKRAQYRLGRIYEHGGVAVPRDPTRAVQWYERSARQAYVPAERALGMMYLEGRLVPQDYDAARKWLERAAHDGSARAQLALADLFREGLDRAPDPIMAYVWYDFAAAQGNLAARKKRDEVEKALTPAQLEEAQRTAQALAPSVLGAGHASR